MKRVPLDKCELEVIECNCGYHMGVDATYIEQVGYFTTSCPSCGRLIYTNILDSQAIDFITKDS